MSLSANAESILRASALRRFHAALKRHADKPLNRPMAPVHVGYFEGGYHAALTVAARIARANGAHDIARLILEQSDAIK